MNIEWRRGPRIEDWGTLTLKGQKDEGELAKEIEEKPMNEEENQKRFVSWKPNKESDSIRERRRSS